MPQSLSAVYLHLVFSTKDRRPFLRDPAVRAGCQAYLGEVSKRLDCPTVIVGAVEDHVHILARLSRSVSQADWVKELKRTSSLWIKSHYANLKDFSWQSGYGLFSVSPSNLDAVLTYIGNQEDHHRTTTFQEEYRSLLKKHELSWDERYLWD